MWLLSGAAASGLPVQDFLIEACFKAWFVVFKVHVLNSVSSEMLGLHSDTLRLTKL